MKKIIIIFTLIASFASADTICIDLGDGMMECNGELILILK